jgi:poly(rC)-binding protein 3/4
MVQSALLHIFDRMQELESRTGSKFDQPFQSSARALVLKSQYACLIGLGGSIIKEMVNATGAKIQILDESDVPACGSQYERVLQVSFYWIKEIIIKIRHTGRTCCFFIFA